MNNVLSSDAFLNSKYDCIKYASLFIIARILLANKISPLHESNLENPIFFPNSTNSSNTSWVKMVLLVLIGFVTYWVVIRSLVNETAYVSGDLSVALHDLLYFGTMLLVARLLSGQPLDTPWLTSSLYMILGFISYDIVLRKIAGVNANSKTNLVIDDTLRWTTMYVLAAWLADRHFDKAFIKEMVSVLIGLGVFNYFIAERS